jgi:hypothetical protein
MKPSRRPSPKQEAQRCLAWLLYQVVGAQGNIRLGRMYYKIKLSAHMQDQYEDLHRTLIETEKAIRRELSNIKDQS